MRAEMRWGGKIAVMRQLRLRFILRYCLCMHLSQVEGVYRHPFLRPLDDSRALTESVSLKVHLSHTLEHTHTHTLTDIIPAATYFVNHCGFDDSVVELCAYWGISF